MSLNFRGKNDLFRFIFTAEYKTMLNKTDYNDSERDYWGTGFEATFYNFISLRLGGLSNPYQSIYGNKGVLSSRLGFGINVPFGLLKLNSPVAVMFDYAVIPLSNINYIFRSDRKNLDAFNLQISYSPF